MRDQPFPPRLHAEDPAFEIVNPEGDPEILLLCDHASNAVPEEMGTLGLPPEEFRRHTAYDIGARGATLALAELLDAPAVLSRFSRLVIDPNRGDDDPTLVRKISDGAIIPGNRQADAAEAQRRRMRWMSPYHAAITQRVEAALARGVRPKLLSMHSFTPRMALGPPRPWHVGVLWDHDDGRMALPLMGALAQEPDLVVGDNEPYAGRLKGDTMWRHALQRGLAHVVLEIRQDLIGDAAGERLWAERLAPALRLAVESARLGEA
ncbi:N-formylglutamate amidohydrolase [Neomegalonema sp.]|uniref:N-formylglutamate amidohydrolase n=1 Tax=Neomegalonema sp. TaxID=2039713 RepID=UPI002636EE2F|nr:N-formylglutamate amidohydrolase [Neomegalonema sp.]MDD2866970.1 N-formylglutamate amidohydrolase [Neomegalonema sp.]